METDTASIKIENGNNVCHPVFEHPTQPIFVARGAGTELNPIVVEPLEPAEPVRDFHKGIDRCMKEWLPMLNFIAPRTKLVQSKLPHTRMSTS